jgi:uncharacterized repeat protein (TIGR03837 family)
MTAWKNEADVGFLHERVVMKASWDIFCSVIDNYGDIGVTWRLARQLVAEHDQAVRLWVDDLDAFARICPDADLQASRQLQQGVELCQWPGQWLAVEPADLVIEAFACNLPAAYIEAMAQRPNKPLWLNLEYLSAEDWVAGCHGLPSLQSNGLQKFFFFPGFTTGTGGLLRERELLAQRQAWQRDDAGQEAFLRRLGVEPLAGARRISLFAYENPVLPGWLDALVADQQVTQLLVPEGRVLQTLRAWSGGAPLAVGDRLQHGQLHIQVLPFVSQDDYDRLLWSCDLNAVRGEDSFVRAQWAGRPFIWHIYQQAEDAHLDKLEAFLDRYKETLSPAAAEALSGMWRAWNQAGEADEHWQALQRSWPEQCELAERWCMQQTSQTDLATALVLFYQNWL